MNLIKPKYLLAIIVLLLFLGGGTYYYTIKPKSIINRSIYSNVLQDLPTVIDATENQNFKILALPNCILKINTAWGTKTYDLTNGFFLPKEIAAEAGKHYLTVLCDLQKKESRVLKVNSLEPKNILQSYIGSKSIPADNGLHWAMLTVLPVDKFNNMVNDSTLITFKELRPNGLIKENNKNTKDGVAFTKILSQTLKGKTLISASIGAAYGKEKELLELANFPKEILLSSESETHYADSRQFFKIVTKELFDSYGNRVSDGTLIQIKVTDVKGNQSFYRTYTIDGVASVNIQNPDNPGDVKILAYIDNLVQSEPLQMYFKPYITDFSMKILNNGGFLEIGPVIGPLNQIVSDGKEVNVEFTKTQMTIKGIIRDGKAKVEIPKNIRKGEKIKVSIGGMQKDIKI